MEFQAVPEYKAYGGPVKPVVLAEWCEQHLPEGSWWYIGFNYFGFDCEQNQLLFTLRWA